LSEIIEKFKEVDTSEFPDFDSLETPLERSLWVLWVSKDKLGINKLTIEQIVEILRESKEISMSYKSIANAFRRAGDKIHVYVRVRDSAFFEIMKPGKEFLLSKVKEGFVKLFYFEPGERFSSKKILSERILDSLDGDLKLVDPYCNERTLDVLKDIGDKRVKMLTRLENIREKKRNRFLRELNDFKFENKNVEFRNYPFTDIHDRYIISSDHLVILGHSIKDLGNKESFAIVLNKMTSRNIVEALEENFNRRWKKSEVI